MYRRVAFLCLWASAASAFLLPPRPSVEVRRVTAEWSSSRVAVEASRRRSGDAHQDEPAGSGHASANRKRFNPLRVLTKRGMRNRVMSVAAAVVLSRGSVAHAKKAPIQVDCSDETAYAGRKNTKQNQKKSNLLFAATVPVFIKLQLDRSKARQEREQTRVKTAIEKLEVMRDEFMNVEGQASTDEDMFASLRERSVEIEEAAEDEEGEPAPLADELDDDDDARAAPAASAAPVDSGEEVDLFAGSSSVFGTGSMAPSSDVTAKADLESPDELAERDAAGSSGSDDDDAGPAMGSNDDIERLNRMFGGASSEK